MTQPKHDLLSLALEDLRNRPIVEQSRDYARAWERSTFRRHRMRTLALRSIGALAALGVAVFLSVPHLAARLFVSNVYETGIGKTQWIALADGSRVMLDTRSRIRVSYSESARDVELLDGQAHFDVAKNPSRPFRVRTAFAEVVAVGTSFDVTAQPQRTTVTLIEGRVNVRSVVNSRGPGFQPETLTPGQQLEVSEDGRFLGKKPVRLASVTSWQRGTISLDDVPLAEALATLNRYSTTQIVIEDGSLQTRRVSGVFVTGDVKTEVLVLQRFLRLREHSRSAERIVLVPEFPGQQDDQLNQELTPLRDLH